MENQQSQNDYQNKNYQLGRASFLGLVVLGIGSLLFANQLGIEFPSWLFNWKMALIAISLAIGIKHSFKTWGWIIPLIIGLAFLAQDYFLTIHIKHFIWPVVIMLIGLKMVFKPRHPHAWKRHRMRRNWERHADRWKEYEKKYTAQYASETNNGEDDRIDITAVFGGVKKNMISKQFKGGDITCFFGGAEINLTQTDIEGTVILDVTAIMGGAQIIIPGHWTVQSEMTAVMGSVEDKRSSLHNIEPDHHKILILRGTAVMGGIEICSF